MTDTYLYHPAEFPKPPVTVNSITLIFDIHETETTVSADTAFTAECDLSEIKLNAKKLEILSVSVNKRKSHYIYEKDILTIPFARTIKKGTSFHISTETKCRPTDNILEGLYYDITPEGQPRTMITQCQQWGFQRMVPCIDDMRAKCTWRTTIIADSRYTNLISNGNVALPRTRYDSERDVITYANNEKMPPYLFFLGVGTWDTFSRRFIYPDGKEVMLELMLPRGADETNAEKALDIMSDAILWTHIYTGPERYENLPLRDEIYQLCRSREVRLKEDADITGISAEIAEKAKQLVFGYQYPYEVYREIAMHNSDFGGMENTGNTTIIASRIMPDANITDASYEYMLGVKQHEFYHNLNGSGVTGDTPFSIWLNEAVTVMIEDDYLAFHFGKDYIRLTELLQMHTPGIGTFSLDTGSISMPIEPSGFNDPNDLITSVTYVKAPEFTRMIENALGKAPFAWALDLYHKRYNGGNASPADFLRTMEDVGKTDFSFMADRWLHQTGFPTVCAEAEWCEETQTAEITVKQEGFGTQNPWIFYLTGQLCDEEGTVISEFTQKIESESAVFNVVCPRAFTFTVWNPGHAAYIKMKEDVSDDILYLRMEKSQDASTKFLSFAALFDREMIKLCEDESRVPEKRLIDAYVSLAENDNLMQSCGAIPLILFEHCSDARFTWSYTKLWSARRRFMYEAAKNRSVTLRKIVEKYSLLAGENPDLADLGKIFKARAVRNAVSGILSTLDTYETWHMIKKSLNGADNASVYLASLTQYLSSSAPDRLDVLKTEAEKARENAIAFENFIGAAALSSSPDTVSYLEYIETLPEFRCEQSGLSRAMYLRFAENRKLSLETPSGRAFLEKSLIKMAPVNEYLANGMLNVFSHLLDYAPEIQAPLREILLHLKASVSAESAPSVISKTDALLKV
ncbi:MAG TPA: M1 family metallopeptidase [Methanocorpusculum sp.]|nr:M1 family metallopeptidase [Methanocorpusculum sp.]